MMALMIGGNRTGKNMKLSSKLVGIASSGTNLIGLCADGSLHLLTMGNGAMITGGRCILSANDKGQPKQKESAWKIEQSIKGIKKSLAEIRSKERNYFYSPPDGDPHALPVKTLKQDPQNSVNLLKGSLARFEKQHIEALAEESLGV